MVKLPKTNVSDHLLCHKHDCTWETSYNVFKRSKHGCPLCGHDSASQKLKGRTYSEATLKKMCVSANKRPDRGGKPRRWRETHTYRKWVRTVRNEWNNECAITGLQNKEEGDGLLVVHHLVGASHNNHLVFVVENGILLHKVLHTMFHVKYPKNNTVEQFITFIQQILNKEIEMPISSLIGPNEPVGSETRVYAPERLKRLHEYLVEIKDVLDAIVPPESLQEGG